MAMPVKTLNQTEEYIDLNKLFGYQRQIYMILTDRGFGKTYATKSQFIREFIKKGKQFIYLRRYKSEMKMIGTFFDDVAHLFPDHEFKIKGWNFYIDNKLAGVGMVLTRYQDYKGGAFPNFDNLMFDEFLREKVKSVGYLPNDTEAFLSICDSVFRKRKGVKAVMISNTVNEVNPYFIDFKINRINNSEYAYPQIPKLKDRILCYIREVDEESKKRSEEASDFRVILSAVDKYRAVALENKFSEDGATFILPKSRDAEFYFAFRLNERETYGVWVDWKEQVMFVSPKYEKTTKRLFAFSKETHNDKTIFVHRWKDEYVITRLVNAFKKSDLYFDRLEVKMNMFSLFSKLRIF